MGVLKGWKVGEIGGNHATMLNILQLTNKAKKIGAGAGTARCNSPGAGRLTPLVLPPVLTANSSPAISST